MNIENYCHILKQNGNKKHTNFITIPVAVLKVFRFPETKVYYYLLAITSRRRS